MPADTGPLRIADLNTVPSLLDTDLFEILRPTDTTDSKASDAQGSSKASLLSSLATYTASKLTKAAVDACFAPGAAWLAQGTVLTPQTFTGNNLFTAHGAIGNTAAIDDGPISSPGVKSVVFNLSETALAVPNEVYTGFQASLLMNPQVPMPFNSDGYGQWIDIEIDASNTQDWTSSGITGSTVSTINQGAVDVLIMNGMIVSVENNGTGNLGTGVGYFVTYNQNGSGTTDELFAAGVVVTASAPGTITLAQGFGVHLFGDGAGGTIGTGYGIIVQSAESHTVAAYGVYIEDQSGAGSPIAENIHSVGAGSVNIFEGSVAVGRTSKPVASAILEVDSTTQGAAPFPGMTTTQKNAIGTPLERLMVYDLTLHAPYFWNGSAWLPFDSSPTLWGIGPPAAGLDSAGAIYLDLTDASNPQLYYKS